MSGMPRTPLVRLVRGGGVLVTLALAGCALSACGGGTAGASATPAVAAATRTAGSGAGNGGQRTPGVNGLIAAVEGTTMQVQSSTKQTAVGWTATTKVSRSAAGTLADIVVGSCVVVRDVSADATSAAGSPATAVTAASVQVSPATNGTCADGFGGIRGGAPAGMPTGMPTDLPAPPAGDPAPPGATTGAAPGGRIPGGFGVVGLVTDVGSGSFTVASVTPNRGAGVPTSGASTAAAVATTPVVVTTTPSTSVMTTKAATATDIKVGLCATAIGASDDIGRVTATSIVLRDAVDGACATTGGFGGPGGAAPGGAATPGSTNG